MNVIAAVTATESYEKLSSRGLLSQKTQYIPQVHYERLSINCDEEQWATYDGMSSIFSGLLKFVMTDCQTATTIRIVCIKSNAQTTETLKTCL